MLRVFSISFILSSLLLSGCATGPRTAQNRAATPRNPIVIETHGKYVDEDSPLQYVVRFHNSGNQVLSFDYTVADKQGVPHIDREGPNSGLVRNLYPGATLEIPNPLKQRRAFVTLGTVTHGKRTEAELESLYRPKVSLAGGGPDLGPSGLMPDNALPR